MKLSDLPLALLQEIFRFLSPPGYKGYLERFAKLWRQFITAISGKYRKETIFLSLSTSSTIRYTKDESFRRQVDSRITSRQRQLGFALHSLSVSFDELEDLAKLNHSHYLKLRAVHISNLEAITDIHVLELIDCPNISNVAHLGSAQVLSFYQCPGITDVTGLGTVPELSLYQCSNIRNGYNTLTKVQRLCIEDDNLRSTDGFQGVQELFLSCRQLPTISPISISHLQKISLHFCQSIHNISILATVPDIAITYCDQITSIDDLIGTKRLSITNCMKIFDMNLSACQQLYSLHIGYCPLQELIIPKTCRQMKNVSIIGCSNLKKVEIFPSMKTVSIYGCAILQDIIIYNQLESIVINYNVQYGPRVNIKGTVKSVVFNPISF